MIRYTRQFYKNSCSPTALINAAKWAGFRVPAKEFFKYFATQCRFSFKEGTQYTGISDALRKSDEMYFLGFKMNPTLSWLDKKLDSGHALIINYSIADEDHGHSVFCPRRTKCFYYLVNHTTTQTVSRVTREQMKQLLKQKDKQKSFIRSGAWAVKPR